MPKYTSNTDIIDAVEPYKGIIDIPDMKGAMEQSEQPQSGL
jgi:hypothetical protein